MNRQYDSEIQTDYTLFGLKVFILLFRYSPIGIAFLLAARIVSMEDPNLAFYQLALYIVTVFIGLMVHGCFILGGVYAITTLNNPLTLLKGSREALLTALATASR